jgi:6-pyruvoyltetrahydropterin/6-carboxytetrahydropterin synthase
MAVTRVVSVTRAFTFDSAHQLPRHPGVCARLHGHTYRLEVTVSGPVQATGMVIDFADLKLTVQSSVLDDFDHRLLNEIIENPTAERVASDALQRLVAAGLPVTRVRLWETPNCYVEIEP